MVLFLTANTVSAIAVNDSNSLLQPGMGMSWFKAQPQEFKDMIYWIMGAIMFFLLAVFLATSGIAGSSGMLDKSGFVDPNSRSRSNTALFGIFFTLIGVILFISLGLGIFKY